MTQGHACAGESWPRPASAHVPSRGGGRPRKHLPCDHQQVPHRQARPKDNAGARNGESRARFKENNNVYAAALRPGFHTSPHLWDLQHLGAEDDMPALPSQKFIGDSLYRSTFNSPSKNREQAGDMEWHDLPICMHFSRPAHHSFVRPSRGHSVFVESNAKEAGVLAGQHLLCLI
jgi:hypothetical protein